MEELQENTSTEMLPQKPAKPPCVAGEGQSQTPPPMPLECGAPLSLFGVAFGSADTVIHTAFAFQAMLLALFTWAFQRVRLLSSLE